VAACWAAISKGWGRPISFALWDLRNMANRLMCRYSNTNKPCYSSEVTENVPSFRLSTLRYAFPFSRGGGK
jgi:hypothetical protein